MLDRQVAQVSSDLRVRKTGGKVLSRKHRRGQDGGQEECPDHLEGTGGSGCVGRRRFQTRVSLLAKHGETGEEDGGHAEDEEHVAGEDHELGAISRDRQDRHLASLFLAIAALVETETAIRKLMVHFDDGGKGGLPLAIDDLDSTPELSRPAGPSVVVDLESIELDRKRQLELLYLSRNVSVDKLAALIAFPER